MVVAVIAFLCIIIIITESEKLTGSKLGCFADLTKNSDRKTDVVVYDDRAIHAFKQTKFSTKDQEFEKLPSITTNGDIQSISSFDFTKDGSADLFVVTQQSGTVSSYALTVYEDKTNANNAYEKMSNEITLSDENVLVVDANGDFMMDVFGKKDGFAKPGFWFGVASKNAFGTFEEQRDIDADIIMKSASFIDLNQDCVADLVYMTGDSIKIMTSDGKGTFASPKTLATYFGSELLQSQMYFADFNKDGAMDIIIPYKSGNKLAVKQNKLPVAVKKLCKGESRPMNKQSFEQKQLTLHAQDGVKEYKLNEDFPIIVQDVTGDSQINVVAVMEDKVSAEQKVFVYTIPANCGDGAELHPNKELTALFDDYGNNDNQIKNLAFFHSGNFPLGMHFLIQKNNNDFDFIHLENTLVDHNYGFLSVSPLNDVNANDKKYGGLMPGVTIKAFFHDRNGKDIVLTAGNLYQSNSKNHLLPFVVFGLGVPESYIEKLVIAYSFKDYDNVFTQPGVPPNAQLVLFADPRTNMSKWRLETFLAPYITPPILAIIIAVVMGILGGLWAYLESKEKKLMKDDKLKTGSATTNNFFF